MDKQGFLIIAISLLAIPLSIALKMESDRGQIQSHCDSWTSTLPNVPTAPYPPLFASPDPAHEGAYWNEEVITGKRCFSMEVYPSLEINTFHVTIFRHDELKLCRNFGVEQVELLILAYAVNRADRLPFGIVDRDIVKNLNRTCESGSAVFPHARLSEIHVEFPNANHPSQPIDAFGCSYKALGFAPDSASCSGRLIAKPPGSTIGLGSDPVPKIVTCFIWAYRGNGSHKYPNTFSPNQQIYMDFISELGIIGPSSKPVFRSVGKISQVGDPAFKKLPALLCQQPNNIGNLIPCKYHGSCKVTAEYMARPKGNLFTSFYDPVVSEACKCSAVDMSAKFTMRKYKYGGLHYGLPLPATPSDYRRAPFAPVEDPIFGTCLQFYFDMDTNCAVFTMDPCSSPLNTVTRMEISEFHIFAIGSKTHSDGLPFGAWEAVDDSLGNCGNLVNYQATTNREQLWSSMYTASKCASHPPGTIAQAMGMPNGVFPDVWRVKLKTPVVLLDSGGSSPPPPSYVYAVRLDASRFNKLSETYRPSYLSFVLEAHTRVETGNGPASKMQIISLKTPIVKSTYEAHPQVTSVQLLRTESLQSGILPVEYLQLNENWYVDLHHRPQCKNTPDYLFPDMSTVPAQRPPSSVDHGLENVCKCFSPSRPVTPGSNTQPISLPEFISQVSKVASGPSSTPITPECFIQGFDPNSVDVGKGVRIEGCIDDGPTPKLHRLMVYFGLTCAGPAALEVMDMTVLALNHKGYPVGFWDKIDLNTQGPSCESLMEMKAMSGSTPNSKPWQVRNVRPVWTYDCLQKNAIYENTFLHSEKPKMLFFNNNLTVSTNDTKYNYGFCAWWYYKHKYHHMTTDTRTFYMDFQFVVTAYLTHRPSQSTYLVTFRDERLGFNAKTCEADQLNLQGIPFQDIFIKEDYYNQNAHPSQDTCITPLSSIDSTGNNLCGCFIGKDHHRLDPTTHPKNDSLHGLISHLQQCIELSTALNNHPEPFSVVVSYKLADSAQCSDFLLYEVLIQATNENGLPMGSWEEKPLSGGPQCAQANILGEARTSLFSCPLSPKHLTDDLYKTDPLNINLFHFENPWHDKHYTWICARWKYPGEYARRQSYRPENLPEHFQFYAQSNVLHIPSNTWLTAPRFTTTKVAFHVKGHFTKEIHKLPFQHIFDFNIYLAHNYDKRIDADHPCPIPYPKPPPYYSFMCKLFHPDDFQLRVDLDDQESSRAFTYNSHNCYTFTAYPGNEPLSMHLTFRQKKSVHCLKAIHFAVMAYNELGFPVGRTTGGSLSLYDHPFVTEQDPRYCANEDGSVNLDTIVQSKDEMCPFYPIHLIGLDEKNMSFFYRQEVTPETLPRMLALRFKLDEPPSHLCFHWVYDYQPTGQETPKFIQFFIEFFSPLSGENENVGTEFLLRSEKFEMNYVAGTTPPFFRPAKECHDDLDRYGIFTKIPKPSNTWDMLHDYSIYPEKELYRKCLLDYKTSKTCLLKLSIAETQGPTNPVPVVPGILGPGPNKYNNRFNTTKVIYEGCVSEKSCFSPLHEEDRRSDCISEMNCHLMWTVGKQPINSWDDHLPDPQENDEIIVELYAVTKGWVALGFSFDKIMGEDFVLECAKTHPKIDIDSTDETPKIKNSTVDMFYSWNIIRSIYNPMSRDNVRFTLHGDEVARLVHFKFDENSLYCVFYLKSSFQIRSLQTSILHNYDLRSEHYCMLTAYGSEFRNNEDGSVKGIASHVIGKMRAPCRELTDLSVRITPTRSQVDTLQHHGAVMCVAYVGLLVFSVFVARYYKYSLTGQYYGYPTWVWIHALTALAGTVMVIAGWITFSVGKMGWTSPFSSPFHKVIGYMSMILTIFNVLVGYYIRNTETENEKHSAYYLVHGVGGHFALVCALLIIMLCQHVEHAFVPCYTGYFGGGILLVYFVIHVVMSFNRCWLNRLVSNEQKREYTITPFILLTQNVPRRHAAWLAEYPKATKVRKVILCIFFIIVVGFTVAIVCVIVSSERSCALEKKYIAVQG